MGLGRPSGPHEERITGRLVVGSSESCPRVEADRALAWREHYPGLGALIGSRHYRGEQCRSDSLVAEVVADEHVAEVSPAGIIASWAGHAPVLAQSLK
jgi:hypothetical protein